MNNFWHIFFFNFSHYITHQHRKLLTGNLYQTGRQLNCLKAILASVTDIGWMTQCQSNWNINVTSIVTQCFIWLISPAGIKIAAAWKPKLMLATFNNRTWEKLLFSGVQASTSGNHNWSAEQVPVKTMNQSSMYYDVLLWLVTERIVWFETSWINTVRPVTMEISVRVHNTMNKSIVLRDRLPN